MKRKMTRREFLKTSAASAAVLGLSPLTSSLVRAATPKRGGRLRLGIAEAGICDSLDPTSWVKLYERVYLGYSVYNELVEIDPDGNLVPELAESIEPSADVKTWTFKLRKGIQFQNGKTLEAEDVVASFNLHRGETKSPAKVITGQITDIRSDDKNTVVFKLQDGNADFPYYLSDYHLVVLPSKDGVADWKIGKGTGGYQIVEFVPGERIRLKRNPNYWKAGRAHFEEVEILPIPDTTARVNALMAGQVDVIDKPDIKTVDLLKRKSGIVVDEVVSRLHFTFPMLTTVAPFNNNDVRLALKYAINREDLLNRILMGHGQVGNDHPISPVMRYCAADLPQRKYDPERAKFHLKKAGLDSLSVNLHASDAPYAGAVDASMLYKEHAKAAGIEINVVREPSDGYWTNVWMKKPFCALMWSGRLTEDWMFTSAYAADAKWNDTFWNNARFNELLLAARSELNDAKRRQMYGEMQRLVSDDGGAVIFVFANLLHARSERVQHSGKLASNWNLDGSKLLERWWFAD